MNREQMEAWCALEGLGLFEFTDEIANHICYRIAYADDLHWSAKMISYSGYWHEASMGNPESYRPLDWSALTEKAANDLMASIHLLTELTQQT